MKILKKKETLLNEEEVYIGIEPKKKRFNKNMITKTFAGLTLAAGLGITGLAIYDTTIDHTEEICPISKLENIISQDKSEHIHQIFAMREDLTDKGYENVIVNYGACPRETVIKHTVEPIIETKVLIPDGYSEEIDENGEIIYYKEIIVQRGDKIPSGYMLYKSDENNEYCRLYVEPTIITCRALPKGYTLEYDEELGKNIGVAYEKVITSDGKGYIIRSDGNEPEYLLETGDKLSRVRF